ncbi:MAG: hypothetical protein VXW70_04530 [Candidatus Thermoplasmatota archaeon]|nr:hypothetical protein [Candidatus Thermoplasmatota archaeon]MEC8248940.1 hypothetical protein [Candidatus Thermoplasmatota archaeon]MEC8257578.1 hypothetical protein [Candidatus Thermoplasmatota archaeon]
MEEYVVADLVKSNYIVNAAILDPDGFIIAALPDDEKTKRLLSKLAEVQYVKDNTSQTTIIAEKMTIMINLLAKKHALVVGCESNSNLGLVRQTISTAVARIDGYLEAKKR